MSKLSRNASSDQPRPDSPAASWPAWTDRSRFTIAPAPVAGGAPLPGFRWTVRGEEYLYRTPAGRLAARVVEVWGSPHPDRCDPEMVGWTWRLVADPGINISASGPPYGSIASAKLAAEVAVAATAVLGTFTAAGDAEPVSPDDFGQPFDTFGSGRIEAELEAREYRNAQCDFERQEFEQWIRTNGPVEVEPLGPSDDDWQSYGAVVSWTEAYEQHCSDRDDRVRNEALYRDSD